MLPVFILDPADSEVDLQVEVWGLSVPPSSEYSLLLSIIINHFLPPGRERISHSKGLNHYFLLPHNTYSSNGVYELKANPDYGHRPCNEIKFSNPDFLPGKINNKTG